MSKFNKSGNVTPPRVAGQGKPLITTESLPTGVTYEGAPGYARGLRGELFIFAVNNMVGEKTFYEPVAERDERFRQLVHAVSAQDPEWLVDMITWLRGPGNMRTASVVMAAEMARFFQKNPSNNVIKATRVIAEDLRQKGPVRRAVNAACQRADEPGEMLGYWISRYGRSIPKPMKRGLGDAVQRLYTQRSLLKYDTATHDVRFADVLEMIHPTPADDKPWQGDLFKYAIDRRHGRDIEVAESLHTINAQRFLRGEVVLHPEELYDVDKLSHAGMTWEDTLSLGGSLNLSKKKLWESIIPHMGVMALVRNLRNFDEAGVSDEVAAQVVNRLMDPEEIKRSRMMPFRFHSAWKSVSSMRWAQALEKALALSTVNIPILSGRSLILVDLSGSMTQTVSAKSQVQLHEIAALFGTALAVHNYGNVDLVGFATSSNMFRHVQRGASILRTMEEFTRSCSGVGGGTDIASALANNFHGQDRVFILSDMQTINSDGTVSSGYGGWGYRKAPVINIPDTTPVYGFNLAGYKHTPMQASPYRHEYGGLSDATFSMIPLLEMGRDGNDKWPWIK